MSIPLGGSCLLRVLLGTIYPGEGERANCGSYPVNQKLGPWNKKNKIKYVLYTTPLYP